ncbi:MAG: ParB/RepB/Spo0J family partition protein [Oscillospiraceae bacterium]|nr:ParB/RepB/Spo0J family partition protein [Oscillospiraceae bacterium]
MAKIFLPKKEKIAAKVVEIPCEAIAPNPYQPRKTFTRDELMNLASSIRADGILQPLSVRETATGYELIAGERRLRAAMIAGLETVPCIIIDASDRTSALLSLVENLQREDLSFFEEADAISKLIDLYGMTQEDAAYRLGYAQSTLANKLRLLKLTASQRQIITENGLTERHARALLKLPTDEKRDEALKKVVKGKLNVEKTEALVESMLEYDKYCQRIRKGSAVLKDVRLFMNTVNKAVETMQIAGVDVNVDKRQSEEYLDYYIRIPLKR